jgi:epoxyqueuosine reductase
MTNLNLSIKSILKPYFVDYVGFADLRKYETELVIYGGNIIKGYKYGISLGVIIPDSIVDYLPERHDANVAGYNSVYGYDVLNSRLNLTASVVSSYLNQHGYRTLPVTVADRTNEEKAMPTISHKMIAHIAGLGWIGKNCLLITPEHGPRLHLISILTDTPLETVDNQLEQRCDECMRCVDICPVKAFTGKNYVVGQPCEARFDFMKYQSYFESMKRTQKYSVCGLCLYAYPYDQK